jgi:hypothetical protein
MRARSRQRQNGAAKEAGSVGGQASATTAAGEAGAQRRRTRGRRGGARKNGAAPAANGTSGAPRTTGASAGGASANGKPAAAQGKPNVVESIQLITNWPRDDIKELLAKYGNDAQRVTSAILDGEEGHSRESFQVVAKKKVCQSIACIASLACRRLSSARTARCARTIFARSIDSPAPRARRSLERAACQSTRCATDVV